MWFKGHTLARIQALLPSLTYAGMEALQYAEGARLLGSSSIFFSQKLLFHSIYFSNSSWPHCSSHTIKLGFPPPLLSSPNLLSPSGTKES